MKVELEKLKKVCPMPWYLDYDTDSGICVKDCCGDIIYVEDYGMIPDEASAYVFDQIISRARSIAYFLVEFSKTND
jgi:hypothetical protein